MNVLCFTVVVLSLNKFWTIDVNKQILHKKWSFPLRISLVNVTKSAVSCGFGHIYWRNSRWKTLFFVHWKIRSTCAWQMLYLDYSNLQERRNVSKFTWLLEEVDFFFMSLSCWNECALVLCTRGRWVPYKIKVGNFLVNMIMLFFNICQQLPMLTWIWKAADQVSLPDCLYFLRYWSRYVLQL